MDYTISSIQAAIDAGTNIAEPKVPTHHKDGRIPYAVVPDNCKVLSLEHLLPYPTRARGRVEVADDSSFIAYVNGHKGSGRTTIYVDMDSQNSKISLVAVLDDHSREDGDKTAKEPGFREHLCVMNPKHSVEWTRWTGKNKAPMSQAEFATWLEDNLPDIADVADMPTGAEMLKMALGFERNAEKRLNSRIDLQSGGVRFEWIDDETKDTRTSMEVFKRFTIGIPVFDGAKVAYPIEARLKYREQPGGGKVSFYYELIRHDLVFRQAVEESVQKIIDGTGILVLSGRPGI